MGGRLVRPFCDGFVDEVKSLTRAKFESEELAVVLSHYDLGILESITEFARGSVNSPKVGIVAERGKFLLKRRADERGAGKRVRFAHAVIAQLVSNGFPAARPVPSRDRKQTIVLFRESIYELFEFIRGQTYSQTEEETYAGGEMLARFHQALAEVELPPSLEAPAGDYHDCAAVRSGLATIRNSIASHDSFSGHEAELPELVGLLLSMYDEACDQVVAAGLDSRPLCLTHGDWHPGNVLYRGGKVLAVVDFDSARVSRRILDVGTGALQFSVIGTGEPETWPDHLDEARLRAFVTGYDSIAPLSSEDKQMIPNLMIQALISECVAPIAATGSMGHWSGFRMLEMVKRKVNWLAAHRDTMLLPART